MRLSSNPRRPQRDLQHVAFAWSVYPIHVRANLTPVLSIPDEVALAQVVRYVDSPTPGVSDAAFGALRTATRTVADARAIWNPVRLWDVEGARAAIDAALRQGSWKQRLMATDVASAVPLATFPFRELATQDPIFTVRWRAIRALAILGEHDGLAEMLAACLPPGVSRSMLEHPYTTSLERLPCAFDLLRTWHELASRGIELGPVECVLDVQE